MDKDITREISGYILDHTTSEDPVLHELYRETNLKAVYPRMVSGHPQGKLIEMLSCMIRPFKILEIGTFTGYSAICLARGLRREGMLHTIEINDELGEMALRYFSKAGLQDRIILHNGDALKIIPALEDMFDMVFIDGNKQQYVQYYQLVFPKVVPGGYILADNVLWDGKVVQEPETMDKETRGIAVFNDFVYQDERVEQVILPIRDGLTIVKKLNF
ncbi:MAG: O-methyltransferase [Bacteroidales bacterium]|nr:O-methyltransferase [Bacteroidales bacterium]